MNYACDPADHPIQLSEKQIDAIHKFRACGNDALKIAAQLGADMQLEKCIEWLHGIDMLNTANAVMAAMRPRPLSKREQALEILNTKAVGSPGRVQLRLLGSDVALLREALMEGQQ